MSAGHNRPSNFIDLTGQIFTRLTVIGCGGYIDRRVAWACRCECGASVLVQGKLLRSGNTRSCGCLQRTKASARAKVGITTTHGASRQGEHHRTYKIWAGMLARCRTPTHQAYKWYGARGVKVCGRWGQFENFLADMGAAPERMSIERLDVNGDYEPSNCKWATAGEQALNRRTNRRISHEGETWTVTEWAAKLGLNVSTLRYRLRAWGVNRALSHENRS
jgi:streptogramin lyase